MIALSIGQAYFVMTEHALLYHPYSEYSKYGTYFAWSTMILVKQKSKIISSNDTEMFENHQIWDIVVSGKRAPYTSTNQSLNSYSLIENFKIFFDQFEGENPHFVSMLKAEIL